MFMADTQLIKQYWSVQDLNLGPLEFITIALTIWANRLCYFDQLAVFHVTRHNVLYTRPNIYENLIHASTKLQPETLHFIDV